MFCLAMLALLGCLSCSTTKQPPGNGNGSQKGEKPQPLPTPSTAGTPASATQPAEPLVPRWSLFDHLAETQLDSGGILADLGTESGDAYTLGGWTSGWKGRREENGTTYEYAASSVCRVWIPSDEAGAGTFSIRAKGEGSLSGKAYLNGKLIGSFEMNRNDWLISEIPFDEGLKQGLNEVLFRFKEFRTVAPDLRAAAAVDYVRLGPAEEDTGPAAASMDAIKVDIDSHGKRSVGLRLEPGERISFFLPLASRSALSLACKGEASDSRLTLSIRMDGEEPRELGSVEAKTDDWKDETADLGLKGDVETWCRVDLAAEGSASVLLSRVEVLAPSVAEPETFKPSPEPWRNAILILVDALRADRVKSINKTAVLEGLSLDGLPGQRVVFENAYSAENWTKPSVASLLTGLFPSRHGAKTTEAVLSEHIKTLASHLKGQGLETAAFIANGYISSHYGFGRDWGSYLNYVQSGKPNRAEFVYADAKAWLQALPRDRRFFLYIHAIDPHVPYIPPESYIKQIDPQPYKGPVEPRQTASLLERIKTGRVSLTDEDRNRIRVLYDAEVAYHNEHFRTFMKYLEESGLLKTTAVWITADHGEELFDHESVGHGHTLYEELIHVPLIGLLPAAETKTRSLAGLVSLVDVAPTLVQGLKVDPLPLSDGTSLFLKQNQPGPVMSEFLEGQRAIRIGNDKLIQRGVHTTLFDLRTDPKETKDLSDDRPLTVLVLRSALGRLLGRLDPVVDAGR